MVDSIIFFFTTLLLLKFLLSFLCCLNYAAKYATKIFPLNFGKFRRGPGLFKLFLLNCSLIYGPFLSNDSARFGDNENWSVSILEKTELFFQDNAKWFIFIRFLASKSSYVPPNEVLYDLNLGLQYPDNIVVKRSLPTVCFPHKGINPST